MELPKLNALISLLDDPDVNIFNQVREEIKKMGPMAIQPLEEAWVQSHDSTFQARVENLVHEIQFENVKKQLINWAKSENKDLLKGALLIAQLQYPELDEAKIKMTIEKISKDIWIELNNNLTALEKVKVINHIFFEVYGFTGNIDNYHAPQNSFINAVIESKKGNPLSLSILYILIAHRLGLPIYGVNLPEHFVLCYLDTHKANELAGHINEIPVLFYINAFSKGIVFSKHDIDNFLKQLNLEPRKHYYEPCNNLEIIKRILRNLSLAFERSNQNAKKKEMIKLLEVLEDNQSEN